MTETITAQAAPPTRTRRRARRIPAILLLLLVCLAVVSGVVAWRRKTVRDTAAMCADGLRLCYLAHQHLPTDAGGLPVSKAIVYTLGQDVGWRASPKEQAYLRFPRVVHHGLDISGQPDAIYRPADPAYRRKSASVSNLNTVTPSDQISPSSYLWLPKDQPELLLACPYHRIAVRKEDGRVVAWQEAGR